MKKNRNRIKIAMSTLVGILVLVLLASCSTPASTPSTPPSTTESTAKPVKEKIVRVVQSWPLYIDPAVGYDNVAEICVQNLYDTLVTLGDDGTIQPAAAKSWEFDEPSLTYTFKLRNDIKFHNGDILTADDVVFSLKRFIDIGEGWAYLFKDIVKDSRAIDKETVAITLNRPSGPFLSFLVHLSILNRKQVLEHIQKDGPYGEYGDYGKAWLLLNDAGSGPYKVKEVQLESHIIAEKFDQYWKPFDKDAPDEFRIDGTTEPVTVRTLMARKELEITDEWQPAENYEAMAKLPGVKIANIDAGSICFLLFNTSKPPLDDVHVRRALTYAFDYETAIKTIFPGGKVPNGPVAPSVPGADSSLPPLKQDLEKAKEELAQSKYFGKLDQFPIEFWWIAEVPDEEKLALLLQSSAKDLGIVINVVKAPWTNLVQASAKPETTPHICIVIMTSIAFPEAGAKLKENYYSTSRGSYNNTHWFDDTTQKEIDRMIDDALSTIDSAERFKKYAEIEKKIIDLAPDIWAAIVPQKHAYQADYLIWPTAQKAEAGEKVNLLPGLRMKFMDMRLIEKNMP